MSTVPRHSEEELRQQWAFLDALVDRQASSLRAGSQDPEEEDLASVVAAPEASYLEEISTLTRRVSTLEGERTTLRRRLDLAEEARMAAEGAREAADAGRVAAEKALAAARVDAEGARIAQGLPPARESAAGLENDTELETPEQERALIHIEPVAKEPPPVATATAAEPDEQIPTTVNAAEPVPVVAPDAPQVAPQEAAPAAPVPLKSRRKTWWQRLRG